MCKRARIWALVVFGMLILTAVASAQTRDPVSPGAGRAVLLATNSIQVDRDSVFTSGDLVVNDASAGPFLGEAQLALDQGVTTAAGSRVMANSVDFDSGAVIGSDVYYNTLSNNGTVNGALHTPLSLPVFAKLPEVPVRAAGHDIVSVPAGMTVDVAPDEYTLLNIGAGGTARLTGEGYTFTAITGLDGAAIQCVVACNVHVRTQVTMGNNSIISGTGAANVMIQVEGTGSLSAPVVKLGRGSNTSANIHAPGGTIRFERENTATGAYFARDIFVGRASHFTLASALDRPPTADAQIIFTDGATPVTITLTGSDPEGGALTFAIVTPPTQGSLSPLVGNVTTYTPTTAGNLEDSFTFSVTDPLGNSGSAVVRINPARVEPPPTVTTVVADDLFGTVTQNDTQTLVLTASAPTGVTLTFTIVSGSGPSHGTLGPISHGSQVLVDYTPNLDYTGPDSFGFQACGVISGNTVCDTATYHLTVIEYRVEPPQLAHDVTVTTNVNTQVQVTLGLQSAETLRTTIIRPMAAFLDQAEVGGTVADSNNDGIGDNHMALPASVPVFMSAGVGQSGGPGSNGTVRMQFEWDITAFDGSMGALRTAQVILHTHRGTVDSLNTKFFHVQTMNDGALTDGDFAAASAERIPGVLMDVPPSMQVGDESTFSFDVFGELKTSVESGLNYFVLQGRVDEATPGTARGLEVRTSVSTNQDDFLDPVLSLTTPGVIAPLEYTVTSLPANGTLFDGNTAITSVPYLLPASLVTFTPSTGFVGDTSFSFQVSNGQTFASAVATIRVRLLNCATNPEGCDNGR